MIIQKLSKLLNYFLIKKLAEIQPLYAPTPYLNNHYFQSIYQLYSPHIDINFQRQKVFFTDGGHVSLDWAGKCSNKDTTKPIVFVMHGMTGGSETKYIRVLAEKALENNYMCVCLNGRGINSQMTSPIPFVGYSFHELQQSLKRIQIHYPKSPLHVIGTSLGGNLVLRYLIKNKVPNVKSLSLISAPFNVQHAIDNMHPWYQQFFIKSYIENTVCRHQQMKFWWDNQIVDLKHLKQSKTLRDFHQRITTKVTGYEDLNLFFNKFKIQNQQLEKFDLDTFVLSAEDDPMVKFQSIPIETLKKNRNIKFLSTKTGGHLCWFQGWKQPQRWYPKPVFQFINFIQKDVNNKVY